MDIRVKETCWSLSPLFPTAELLAELLCCQEEGGGEGGERKFKLSELQSHYFHLEIYCNYIFLSRLLGAAEMQS